MEKIERKFYKVQNAEILNILDGKFTQIKKDSQQTEDSSIF